VQALTPDHRARLVFRLWLLAKCAVNPQFVVNVMFTDEAGFTRDCAVNFRRTHVWTDDNPDTTVTSKHQHRLFVNICVGILGDQLLWPVVLPNKLPGSVYHVFSAYFPYLKKYAYDITKLSVCVFPATNCCIHEAVFMKFGMYVMAPEPISLVYFISPSHQSVPVCLYLYRC
jgi:hypothetical protein